MILTRGSVILAALLLLGAPGCLSLPEAAPATERSSVGDPAPVLTLARTGATPGMLSLSELWGGKTAAVLVFYRGEW